MLSVEITVVIVVVIVVGDSGGDSGGDSDNRIGNWRSFSYGGSNNGGGNNGIGFMEIGLNDGTGVYNNVVVLDGSPNAAGAVETLFLADGDTLYFEFERNDYALIQLYKDGTLVSEVKCGEIDSSTQKSSIKTKDLLGFSNVRGVNIIRRIRGLEYIG